jgi:3',5'-cyclic AMP phosphodiesterase CpdA
MLRMVPVWSAYGNHDAHTANGAPYFNAFTFPRMGEAGGVPSGTENYYSFDYGDIHFVCIDSQISSHRQSGSAMIRWLEEDLAATTRKWIVAFWHHPPYSKGSHDSDSENSMVQMRTNVLPILEAHGVDLVLCGHSHSFERSMLIDGHYGLSNSFDPAVMAKASAPQKTTRATDRLTGAPPALAPRAPSKASPSKADPATHSPRPFMGAKAVTIRGRAAPAEKVTAEVIAA